MVRQTTLDEIYPSSGPSPVKAKRVPRKDKLLPSSSPIRARGGKSGNRRRRQHVPSDSPDSSEGSESDDNVGDIQFESSSGKGEIVIMDDTDADDDDEPIVLPTQRYQPKRAPPTPPSSDSESVLSQMSEEEDVPAIISSRKGKKRLLADSDEEEETKRRKLVRGKPRAHSDSEESGNLEDEVDADLIIDDRLRKITPKQTTRSVKLEEMKRRRKGLAAVARREEAEDESSSDELEIIGADKTAPFRSAKPEGEKLSDVEYDEDQEDDGFIVEDDDNEPAVELPAQFSRQSHQDMNVHFKVVCQLFVHSALQDEEDREEFMISVRESGDNYFGLSYRALERKLGSLKDSLVRSAAWKPEFTKALNKHPEFDANQLDFSVPVCDACKISGRVATLVARCSGPTYSRDTLEPLDGSDVYGEDDEEEEEDYEGNHSYRDFNLGRFCARRAQVYHSFTHWEYHLYQALKREIEVLHSPDLPRRGVPFVIVARSAEGGLPEDDRNGDQVMSWLDGRGIIQSEWIKMKQLMEEPHNLDARHKTGDDDFE